MKGKSFKTDNTKDNDPQELGETDGCLGLPFLESWQDSMNPIGRNEMYSIVKRPILKMKDFKFW